MKDETKELTGRPSGFYETLDAFYAGEDFGVTDEYVLEAFKRIRVSIESLFGVYERDAIGYDDETAGVRVRYGILGDGFSAVIFAYLYEYADNSRLPDYEEVFGEGFEILPGLVYPPN